MDIYPPGRRSRHIGSDAAVTCGELHVGSCRAYLRELVEFRRVRVISQTCAVGQGTRVRTFL